MFKDKLRQEIKVGAMVCYASSGNYPTPYIGKVVGFTPKKVKVVEMFPYYYNESGKASFRLYNSVINKEADNLIQIPNIVAKFYGSNDEEIQWSDITLENCKARLL